MKAFDEGSLQGIASVAAGESQRTGRPRVALAWRVELAPLDAICLAYIAFPLLLFLLGFASFYVAVAGCIALAATAGCVRIRRGTRSVSASRAAGLAALAFGLCLLIGLFAPFNPPLDWSKHYPIYFLLIDNEWPVVRPAQGDALRYYLGMYLPPALLSKMLGRWSADIAMFAWIWLGLWLFLMLLASRIQSRRVWLVILIFFAFAGADVVGQALWKPDWRFGRHLEWWADLLSFTSHVSMLVWVPQHALSGWIGAALLLRPRSEIVPVGGVLLAATCFWSPFSALGLLPFLLLRVCEHGGLFRIWSVPNIVAAPILGLPLAAYLTHGTAGIASSAIWVVQGFSWTKLFAFYAIEFLAFALAVLAFKPRLGPTFYLALVLLILLPLWHFGHANDFAMRATLPALAILVILAAEAMTTLPLWRNLAAAAILAVGIVGPLSDFAGILSRSDRDNFKRLSFEAFLRINYPARYPQYLAPYPHWTLR